LYDGDWLAGTMVQYWHGSVMVKEDAREHVLATMLRKCASV
jgi:hypothetical protein